MDELNWTPDTARLDSFDLWARNPKTMSKARAARLRKSWEEMGQYQTLAVGPDGECYDGHQRVKTLQSAGYPGDYLIAVRRSNRPLTEDERERVIVESTVGTVGAFNWQEMAGWDTSALIERGLDTEALATWNADAAELGAMLTAETIANDGDANSAGGIRPWDTLTQKDGGSTVRVIIGDIETVLINDIYEQLAARLDFSDDARGMFERIIAAGVLGADSDS